MFAEWESGDTKDPKTKLPMKTTKIDYIAPNICANWLKTLRGMCTSDIGYVADICRGVIGNRRESYIVKNVKDYIKKRKQKDACYISIANCLEKGGLFMSEFEGKPVVNRIKWKQWKKDNNFTPETRLRLMECLGTDYLDAFLKPTEKKRPIPDRFKKIVALLMERAQSIPISKLDNTFLVIDINGMCTINDPGSEWKSIHHALFDTRFLVPEFWVGMPEKKDCAELTKMVVEGLDAASPSLTRIPKFWTFVVDGDDATDVFNVLKKHFQRGLRCSEAFYKALGG